MSKLFIMRFHCTDLYTCKSSMCTSHLNQIHYREGVICMVSGKMRPLCNGFYCRAGPCTITANLTVYNLCLSMVRCMMTTLSCIVRHFNVNVDNVNIVLGAKCWFVRCVMSNFNSFKNYHRSRKQSTKNTTSVGLPLMFCEPRKKNRI